MDKWKQLEQSLSGVFGRATITADGHEVKLVKKLDGEKLVIEVYVDGWIKGEWAKANAAGEPEHSEGRFWRPFRSRAWKLSQYKNLRKAFGKKRADEMTALKTFAFMPYWNTPKSLIGHLKKSFPDLEVLESREVHEA